MIGSPGPSFKKAFSRDQVPAVNRASSPPGRTNMDDRSRMTVNVLYQFPCPVSGEGNW
jgi:hypothetical protein